MNNIADIRGEYKLSSLEEDKLLDNPFHQFDVFWKEVIKNKISEPNAMVLSTCFNNKPKSRVVLLKGYDVQGFVFYTNYESKKSKELTKNINASLLFFWKELQKQVRVEGMVRKVSKKKSDEYFSSRPRGSQIAAWASPQSAKISSRDFLNTKVQHYKTSYQNKNTIPRPKNWGGYVLKPQYFEFWQGRESRLHDRIVFKKLPNKTAKWERYRLAP